MTDTKIKSWLLFSGVTFYLDAFGPDEKYELNRVFDTKDKAVNALNQILKNDEDTWKQYYGDDLDYAFVRHQIIVFRAGDRARGRVETLAIEEWEVE